MLLFHYLEGLMLVNERLELIVNNLHSVADHVILLFKGSKGSKDRVVDAFHKNDSLKRVKLMRLRLFFSSYDDALLLLEFFLSQLVLQNVLRAQLILLKITQELRIQTNCVLNCILVGELTFSIFLQEYSKARISIESFRRESILEWVKNIVNWR